MNKHTLLVVIPALSLIGCGGSSGNENNETPLQETLDNTFSEIDSYDRSSFTLSTDAVYWSIVVNETVISEEPSLDVKYSFNEEDYSSLSESQKSDIDTAFSTTGFTRAGCEPEHCPVYAVSLDSEGDVTIVDSDTLLGTFFAPIDTEAELHVYLWANNYDPMSFEEVDGGYQVIAELKTCELVTTNLLFIDHNGVITVEEELDQESEDPPACP